jgi:nucleotide-binding universal stress UspA family protein
LPKKLVVTPVDFSEDLLVSVDAALEMVDDPANVHVIHVLQELSPLEPGEVWHTVNHETRKQHAAKALRERLAGDKYANLPIQILFGDPGHEIADYAEEVAADMIVLPSHGRRGLSRLLIGSVAERVVRLAHCPVLVLRDGRRRGGGDE